MTISLTDALVVLGIDSTAERSARRVTVDQTHESWVLDESVIVKLLNDAPDGIAGDGGADRLSRLDAAGFTGSPALVGIVEQEGTVTAVATRYVPDAVDGWTWCVGEARHALRVDMVDIPGAPVGQTDVQPGWAAQLGELTARMHTALVSTDAAHAAARPTGWSSRAEGPSVETPLVAVHGDYHVGQILRTSSHELWVIDFDGNPTLSPAERLQLRPAAYDVAGMLLSLENVSHVVRRWAAEGGHYVSDDDACDWVDEAQFEFLAAYRSVAGELLDDSLIEPFLVDQLQREFDYAERFLPRWKYVPQAALRRRGLL